MASGKKKKAPEASVWTHFMDMHSGGGLKEKWQHIYIEAPEDVARVIFFNRFGHNPERVTCTCCGDDYSISEEADLAQLTAYQRNCEWRGKGYVEEQEQSKMRIRAQCKTADSDPWGLYQTLEQYRAREDVLFIPASEIKDEERIGEVPQQGYVWQS